MVSVQGDVQLVRGRASARTELNAPLCAGDEIRVPMRGRAAIALNNETMVRLDQGATLTLGAPTADNAAPLGICSGALYVITRTPRRFKVKTPFVNASVDGTEFLVEVERALAPAACTLEEFSPLQVAALLEGARVTVVEGVVTAENGLGVVALKSGEMATDQSPPGGAIAIRPRDAATWTLHVPTVLEYQLAAGAAQRSSEPQQAGDPDRSIRVTATLASLEGTQGDGSVRRSAQRVGLLLLLGRMDEAKSLLRDVFASGTSSSERSFSDMHSLAAVVAVVENDKAEAFTQADAAVRLDPESPAAWLALSFAQQADFRIQEALVSAQKADAVIQPAMWSNPGEAVPNPKRALALARVAELHLANGDLRRAQAAADLALAANPAFARTQMVFGFSYLLRLDIDRAKTAFTRAIQLDQTDPLPRLGLALAKIREGDLSAGRLDLEIAASLDPGNALVRSYLGKAYLEELRGPLARTQFELAKQADPLDPTPHLYNAMRLQAGNQPIDALNDLQRALELNDNRAVYRSRLLLDQDRATRQIDMASVFNDLASDREAVAIASQSVTEDPSNYSAHRFLSEAYARRERNDIARTSEILQAQLLQPSSLSPVAPELPFVDLGSPGAGAPSAAFSNEYSSLFERNRTQVSAGALLGNLGAKSARLVISTLQGPVSASAGYFDTSSDGFRPNGDISHRLRNGFAQFAVSPFLSLQAEYRERHTSYGDVVMHFDPAYFAPRDRNDFDQRSTRAGLTYRPTPQSTLIVSAVSGKEFYDFRLFADAFYDALYKVDDSARVYEIQYQQRSGIANVVAGAGHSRVSGHAYFNFDFTPGFSAPCPAGFEPCTGLSQTKVNQWNGYVYAHFRRIAGVEATVGLSRDAYVNDDLVIRRWNPKFGVRASLTPDTTLRLASFRALKRALLTQQTIEPTQIVGFNQFYDDIAGSDSKFVVGAVDSRWSATSHIGLEVGRQSNRIDSPTGGAGFATVAAQYLTTEWLRVDVNVRPSAELVLAIGAWAERFVFNSTLPGYPSPTYLLTTRVPITARTFLPNGFFADATVTGVAQKVRRLAASPEPVGSDSFALMDLSFGYRLPNGRGTLSLDVKNLFNTKFSYQDDDFRSTETRHAPYLPVRRVWLKASLAF